MIRRQLHVIAFGAVLACQSSCLWGAPTALIQIPTADVAEHRQGYVDIAATLSSEGGDLLSNCVLESCLGLGRHLELGFDGPPRTPHNGAFFFKQRLGSLLGGSAAAGVNGINIEGGPPSPYVVCSTDTSPFRTHMGLECADKKWRGLFGVEHALTGDLTLVADWITGPEGAWSAGFNFTFGRDGAWGLMAGVIQPNTGDDTAVYVNLGRGLDF
jgi:hypothetical protein